MRNRRFFPLYIDLSEKKIVIAGGGKLATRRVKTLLPFTRNITVIAPEVAEDLRVLGMAGHIQVIERGIKKSDVKNAFMVLAATNDWRLNDAIYKLCKEQGIYVNLAGDDEQSDFAFPGICLQDNVVVGVSAPSDDQRRARLLRAAIQKLMERMPGSDET